MRNYKDCGYCCEDYFNAGRSGTDNEGYSSAIHCDDRTIGGYDKIINFCPWCGKQLGGQKPEPKKEGHWECIDIEIWHNMIHGYAVGEYRFMRGGIGFHLFEAYSMVGFGGIEFEECPNCWFMGLGLLHGDGIEHMQYDVREEKVKPATPKRVRFWVEE